jgi:hypothetical protein
VLKAKQIIRSIREALTSQMLDPWLHHLKTKHPMVVGKRDIIEWIDTQMRDYFLNDSDLRHPSMDMELEAHRVFSYLSSEDAPHNLQNLTYLEVLDGSVEWMRRAQGDLKRINRKIIGGEMIDQFILYQQRDERAKGIQKIQDWLKSNLRNYLYQSIPGLEELDPEDAYELPYPDWVLAAVENGETVYRFVPSHQAQEELKQLELDLNVVMDYLASDMSPRNLTRLSVPDAIEKANQWASSVRKEVEAQAPVEGTIVVMEFPNSFKWRQIRTAEALEIEGKVLDLACAHTYADRIENRSYQLYSLRDPQNRPRGVILMRGGSVEEIKGRGNGPVRRTYYQYFYDFLNDFPGGLPNPLKELHNINGVIRDGVVVGKNDESFFEAFMRFN